MEIEAHGRVYCVNSECTKSGTCIRYTEVPRLDGDNKKFEENWNGALCNKYRNRLPGQANPEHSTVPPGAANPIAFSSTIPQEMELREHLVRFVGENLDKVFHGDRVWQQATHQYGHIAARLVDLIMPIVVAKRNMQVRGHK